MGKRRPKRKVQNTKQVQNGSLKPEAKERIPKSMVIRMNASDVGPSVTQLVQDVRRVMEPHTASRLKERKSNRLRDYATMAGPLGVTHFLLFSRSTSGKTNLRIAVTPRGPTLTFRVEKYSLCRDLIKAMKHPKSGGGLDHLNPPLLVMNNFTISNPTASNSSSKEQIPKHLEALATSTFQSLFPPISPQRTPLSSIRRILLLDRELSSSSAEGGTYVINFRHYSISSQPVVSISRGIKRLRHAENRLLSQSSTAPASIDNTGNTAKSRTKSLLNLASFEDVADFVLDPNSAGYTSASETEVDTDAEVDVLGASTHRVLTKNERQRLKQRQKTSSANATVIGGKPLFNRDNEDDATPTANPVSAKNSQKRVIRLTELGPRMRLRLLKVEEGMCTGKVLWHEYIKKTDTEEKKLEKVWETRRVERENRRREQQENVEKKKSEKSGGSGQRTFDRRLSEQELGDGDMDYDDDQ